MNRRACLHSLSALGLLPISTGWEAGGATVLKRVIPSSNESLTAVGLGTWRTFDVGDSVSEREPLKHVLKTLVEHEGTVIDSSPMYGRSENVVGDLSTELNLNDRLFIATKVWTSGAQEGIRQMNTSFSLLRRKKIDLMQIHNLVDWKTHLKTLYNWKEDGKIRYIGITHYTESSFPAIEDILKHNVVDFVQVNYSLMRREAEARLFPLAHEKKVAILVNQPFEAGALFNAVRGKNLPEWANEFDCRSWGQFFLKFILSISTVTCVIPGTSKPHHMVDNMGAAYGKLPTEKHRTQMIKFMNA
ncbi:MAG: aldo/keto reductase [Cyclobacteriaceae bacterium]|nr:aldo/keto reductase [Cyclobacteriaceae bacterium]MDH4295788.1 aldo/keto reductase [Cyclobacteriaceae bacterium]MDH5250272.1 aldo/keto reductase [Cyclobacteriaceae bacterium]